MGLKYRTEIDNMLFDGPENSLVIGNRFPITLSGRLQLHVATYRLSRDHGRRENTALQNEIYVSLSVAVHGCNYLGIACGGRFT